MSTPASTASEPGNTPSFMNRTFLNKGTANRAASDRFSPRTVKNLIEPVRLDLESHCTCGVQRMLAHFISSVAKDGHTLEKGGDDGEYLKPYLDIAVETANEIRDDVRKLQEIMDDSTKREEARYGQFCVTFNKALDKLRPCAQDTLKKCDRLNIMFHRNDPRYLKVFRDDQPIPIRGLDDEVARKIDVGLCSHRAAKEVARGRGTGQESDKYLSWANLALNLEHAGSPPSEGAHFWAREILAALEFKATTGRPTRERIPHQYTANSPTLLASRPISQRLSQTSTTEKKRAAEDRTVSSNKKQKMSADGSAPASATSGEQRPQQQSDTMRPPGSSSRKADSAARRQQEQDHMQNLRAEQDPIKPPPDIQCGIYAMQKLTSAPWVTHAINVILIDENLWVWYYDHQGAIQSQGINFMTDLPYFLVLLLAFQRFSPREWGYSPSMNLDVRSGLHRTRIGTVEGDDVASQSKKKKKAVDRHMRPGFRCCVTKVRSDAFEGAEAQVNNELDEVGFEVGDGDLDDGESDKDLSDETESELFQPDLPPTTSDNDRHEFFIDLADRFSQSYSLVGRATGVFRCIDVKAPSRRLVLKSSWPEVSRKSEGEALQYAHHVGRNFSQITDHLPAMKDLYQRTFHEHDTQIIRDALEVTWVNSPTRKTSRVARYLIEEELCPITQLVGKDFLYAMFSIARCVCLLWILGLQHTDPSLENYMVRLGTAVGVVNDWDLSVLASDTGTQNMERTGTVPYMALELLNADFWNGRIPRLYRHELEGQLWVFVWVCLRYTGGGKLRSGDPLELNAWQTTDYETCADKKWIFTVRRLEKALEFLRDINDDPYYEVYASVADPQLVEYRARLIQADLDRGNKFRSKIVQKAEDQEPPSEPVEEDDNPEGVWNRLWRCLDEGTTRKIMYWDDFRKKYCSLPDVRAGCEVPKRIRPVEAPCPW